MGRATGDGSLPEELLTHLAVGSPDVPDVMGREIEPKPVPQFATPLISSETRARKVMARVPPSIFGDTSFSDRPLLVELHRGRVVFRPGNTVVIHATLALHPCAIREVAQVTEAGQ